MSLSDYSGVFHPSPSLFQPYLLHLCLSFLKPPFLRTVVVVPPKLHAADPWSVLHTFTPEVINAATTLLALLTTGPDIFLGPISWSDIFISYGPSRGSGHRSGSNSVSCHSAPSRLGVVGRYGPAEGQEASILIPHCVFLDIYLSLCLIY